MKIKMKMMKTKDQKMTRKNNKEQAMLIMK